MGWGDDSFGVTNVPDGVSNLIAIAAGSFHNLALRSDGTVIAWGNDTFGQTNVPLNLSNVIAVAAGWNHSAALKNDGTMVCWGDDTFGQTNADSNLTNIVATAAHDGRTLAIEADLRMLSLLKSGQNAALRFWSFAGREYSVEFTPDLGSPNWQTVGTGNIPGTGGEILVTETNVMAVSPQRFYRTREITP